MSNGVDEKWEHLRIVYSDREDFEEAESLLRVSADRIGVADKVFIFNNREEYENAKAKLSAVRRLRDFREEG